MLKTVSTLYLMIPTFNHPEKALLKHSGKRRKCWLPAFSPFPTMFSTLSTSKTIILATFILLSANVFNLDQAEILSFGKDFNTEQSNIQNPVMNMH